MGAEDDIDGGPAPIRPPLARRSMPKTSDNPESPGFDMKITELHVYSHPLPVKDGPYRMANALVWSLDTTLVKLVTDTGLVGWGETCPVGPTSA